MYFRSQRKSSHDVSLFDYIETGTDGAELSLMDVVSADEDLTEQISNQEQIGQVRKLIDTCLTEQEREVICLRYGLENALPRRQREVADAIGISRCHLAHLFRKSTGMSVVAYIQMLRCRHAVVLLGQSDLSIAEIAHECGFESVSYFDRCFARLYGQTPRQIRARRT